MAQKRLRNFEHPILSFEHNIFNLGLHTPGRYLGFDTIEKIGGLQFYLSHIGKNLTYMDPNNSTFGPIGVYLTPQGTIIQENSKVGPFNLDSNIGNSNYRYDLIYAIHNQIELNGGQDATYSILKGSMVSPEKPQITNPLIHTPIGYVELPPGELGDINNCRWLKSRSPDSGDGPDARLDEVNIFTKTQGFSMSPTILAIPTTSYPFSTTNINLWELDDLGNTFRILPRIDTGISSTLDGIKLPNVTLRNGIRIKIWVNEKVMIRDVGGISSPYSDNGYCGFKFKSNLINVQPPVGGMQLFGEVGIRPDKDQMWELDLIYVDGLWNITDLGGRTPLRLTAPNDGLFFDNTTKIIDGSTVSRPGETIIYSKPGIPKFRVLYVGSAHLGDLVPDDVDRDIQFTQNGVDFTVLDTSEYTVLGSLSGGAVGNAGLNNDNTTGLWMVVKGSKTWSGFKIHINEYTRITQDLIFEYVVISNS